MYTIAETARKDMQAASEGNCSIYSTGELDEISTCSILEQVRLEGNRRIKRKLLHYNLDMIIDGGKEIYHIGASLKDLGKKWFAFQRMDKVSVNDIITAVSGLI